MFSALSADFNPGRVVHLDWCILCGKWGPTKPHLFIKGQIREVEDVNPPEGIL